MKLHMYLFHEEVKTFEEGIVEKYLNFEEAKALRSAYIIPAKNISSSKLPLYGYQYISFEHEPSWISDIKDIFETTQLSEASNVTGFLIFHKINNQRIICISYGHGHYAIDKNKIESNFGLKVCANIVDPERLKELDRKSIIEDLSFTRTVYDGDISADNLGIYLPRDWVKVLAGKCLDSDIAEFVSGADALDIKATFPFDEIESKCEKIFKIYKEKKYRKHFKFLDYIQNENDNKIKIKLDEQLIKNINPLNANILLSPSFFIDYTKVKEIFLTKGKEEKSIPMLDASSVFDFFFQDAEPVTKDNLSNWKIKIIFNDDSSKIEKLYKYLHFETTLPLNDHNYILNSGFWLRIDKNYFDFLRTSIDEIDKTNEIQMPIWDKFNEEKEYNSHVEITNSWINLDRVLLSPKDIGDSANKKSRIEFCDLIDEDNSRIIMVKPYKSGAQSISHLFAQARATGSIYNILNKNGLFDLLEDKYLKKHKKKLNLKVLQDPKFIIAIAHPQKDKLSQSLPTLAVLSIYGTLIEYKKMGLSLYLVKIEKS